jgi:hypothetical protein
MSDESSPPRRLSTAQTGLFVFGGLILYVLAPGPLSLLTDLSGSPRIESTLRIVFYPLIFLCDRFPPVARLYDLYLEFLVRLCGLA